MGLAGSPRFEAFVRRHSIKSVLRPVLIPEYLLPFDHWIGFGQPGGRIFHDVLELVAPGGLHPLHRPIHIGDFSGSTAAYLGRRH